MTAAAEVVHPTVILRMGEDTLGAVTAGKGEGEALIVFRGPQDARAFQASVGKWTAGEGYRLIGMNHAALASLVDLLGVRLVAMPERWTGAGGVDTFDAGDFVAMLEEREEGPLD